MCVIQGTRSGRIPIRPLWFANTTTSDLKRLETQPGYAFAVTDLTLTYQNNVCDSGHPERQNPYPAAVVREYYYFRSETPRNAAGVRIRRHRPDAHLSEQCV